MLPLTWSLKDFSRLAMATSSQSPLSHESCHRHPLFSDLKVTNKQSLLKTLVLTSVM